MRTALLRNDDVCRVMGGQSGPHIAARSRTIVYSPAKMQHFRPISRQFHALPLNNPHIRG
jgi:hypothetical protein